MLRQFSSLAIGLCCLHSVTSAQDLTRPNVVLFMADDMGMGDTSAYQDLAGNADADQIHTPNMERLAKMGVRFSDAHTPTSRCSGTRYGLLTGRYPWRNRLKHWVLFGAQGDPMIEKDRPTLASLFHDAGYRSGMVGKWHVGLRYRRSDGRPAAAWEDADLRQQLHTSPVDFGFDYARFTSRSHGTSGPDATQTDPKKVKLNGPGHVHNRTVMAAKDASKHLKTEGRDAYILSELGGRHFKHAKEFLSGHVGNAETRLKPFFLYYPSNSNHGPYTPDEEIDGRQVKGAAHSKSGESMGIRYDFIYENDVALGLLIDWLEATDDPRRPEKKLIENTIVIFTSDNGAEIKAKTATGPVRANKGSAFEGGHRVPYIVSWPAGAVGDGNSNSQGQTNTTRVNLLDCFATFSDVLKLSLPDLTNSEKGAEDSWSVLQAWRGATLNPKHPIFHNDHNDKKRDRAACAVRVDDPVIDGKIVKGKWKIFFDASLIRFGRTKATALYNLELDPMEQNDLLGSRTDDGLVQHLSRLARKHRNAGGLRYASLNLSRTTVFEFSEPSSFARPNWRLVQNGLVIEVTGSSDLVHASKGLGVKGGSNEQAVDSGEHLAIRFNQDVVIENAAIVAGKGSCGGFYQVADASPLAIYCIDADNDAQDQRGNLSDIGYLPKGAALKLDSSPHFGVESAGEWMLKSIRVRAVERE